MATIKRDVQHEMGTNTHAPSPYSIHPWASDSMQICLVSATVTAEPMNPRLPVQGMVETRLSGKTIEWKGWNCVDIPAEESASASPVLAGAGN